MWQTSVHHLQKGPNNVNLCRLCLWETKYTLTTASTGFKVLG